MCVVVKAMITLSLILGTGTSDFLNDSDSNFQDLINFNEKNSSANILTRRRRYVVFPEGSTFTVAFCLSVKALTGSDTIYTEGVNWALSYDLPNETRHDVNKKPTSLRRHRRNLYEKVEILLTSAGFDGRNCVLRTICETAQLIPPRVGIIHEIIRVLFTYPTGGVSSDLQTGRHKAYADAHFRGINNSNCFDMFPCPISLLDLLLQFAIKE